MCTHSLIGIHTTLQPPSPDPLYIHTYIYTYIHTYIHTTNIDLSRSSFRIRICPSQGWEGSPPFNTMVSRTTSAVSRARVKSEETNSSGAGGIVAVNRFKSAAAVCCAGCMCMYVCMFVCIYACMYVCSMYVCMYLCMYVCVCTYGLVSVYIPC